jgi:hypothetical protein
MELADVAGKALGAYNRLDARRVGTCRKDCGWCKLAAEMAAMAKALRSYEWAETARVEDVEEGAFQERMEHRRDAEAEPDPEIARMHRRAHVEDWRDRVEDRLQAIERQLWPAAGRTPEDRLAALEEKAKRHGC